MYKTKIIIFILSAFLIGGFFVFNRISEARAIETDFQPVGVLLDATKVKNNFSADYFDGSFRLTLSSSTFDSAAEIKLEEITIPMPLPWSLEQISPIYQFDIISKTAYPAKKPLIFEIKYATSSTMLKQVYFYDRTKNLWRALPTEDFPEKLMVRTKIHLPFARLAVFADPEKLSVGSASWYSYKNGMFCASPDFPKGSRLRVYNLENNKFIDVEVNDYGPDRKLHPDRVVDLDKKSFLKLAKIGQGIIKVKIELLHLADGSSTKNKPVKISLPVVSPNLKINSKSAVVINENTGEVIWEKNSNQQLPLASLTKLVAAKVFLDTDPMLDRIVEYKYQDEEYNYQYCEKWQSARLRIKEGETLAIKDLLYASIIGSANNTVETLVRVSGLERSEFVARMNQIANDWGASSTKFFEPTGLAPENVSSAMDYAIITTKVFQNKLLEKISSTASYRFSTVNTKIARTIKNSSQLLAGAAGNFKIIGSKTGYLDEAGYCLMTRASIRNGDKIVAVTFGASGKEQSVADGSQLLRYGLTKLK